MNNVTSKSNLSHNTKFAIPDFKLLTLTGSFFSPQSLIKRMAQSVVEVMEDSKGKVHENLLANGVDLTSFVTHFEWDMAKYPAKQPLVSVVDTLAKGSVSLSLLGSPFVPLPSRGNLFTRTLSDIVNKEDFVLDSEYLITLLVIVPKYVDRKMVGVRCSVEKVEEEFLLAWLQPTAWSGVTLGHPADRRFSFRLIAEDNEAGLFTVTLFRKVTEDFKVKAKENKFMVREFYYDENEIKREREEMSRLLSDKKQQYGPLLRWLKVNFSEAFIAWIHIKALRVFVESVLRYGLPVNFQAVLLQPQKKSATKRLREVLNSVFRHLDEVAAASILDASVEIPGLQLSNQDYFPYVYFHIDLSLLD
ncbi:hypothetical protein A6R68_20342 [Neotoma lepida]|uniref:V-type proton ATPase subunit C n=1 Tax=Neotoma lepida TaxID=56216 RepID=A0A1A6HT68_NEOLE|nr:hypothetical protein A6R68_20342 [Neotoma lepida]